MQSWVIWCMMQYICCVCIGYGCIHRGQTFGQTLGQHCRELHVGISKQRLLVMDDMGCVAVWQHTSAVAHKHASTTLPPASLVPNNMLGDATDGTKPWTKRYGQHDGQTWTQMLHVQGTGAQLNGQHDDVLAVVQADGRVEAVVHGASYDTGVVIKVGWVV